MKVLSGLDLSNNSIRNANIDNVKISGESDNLIKIGEHGELVDSGISADSIDLSSYYTKTEVDLALGDKQDVINDLADIRSGAALGATALQEHQDISGKQDVIEDLAEIRSGAALGATALQEHQDISGKQDVLVSGTNIKTINNQSLLGEGNITIEGGGGAAVQSDWEQDDSSADDFIKNKPDLSGFVTEDAVNEAIEYVLTDGEYVTSSDLATVATSGDYSDLQNTPDLSDYVASSDLATVATSGDYSDLQNTPNLSNYVTSSSLAAVATSGDYGDLENAPDLSDYVTSDGLGEAIEGYLYDNLATLIEDSGALSSYPIKETFFIYETDTQGQFTHTETLSGYTDLYPIVQIMYGDQLVFSDVTVTLGTDPNDEDSSTTITVTWDNTKYSVDDNNPLMVTYVIL